MHATIRRYEGVDTTRMNEVAGKVNETLVPQLRELPGFSGYYLIEAGNGVLSSFGLFETSEQADESKTLVTKWISDENFNTLIPNPPKITSGKVVPDRTPHHREGPAAPGPSLCVCQEKTCSRLAGNVGEGFAQGSSADLIAELEAILPELRRRLDDYLERGAYDIIAADEGFNFAGQIQPLLSELAEHAVRTREQLLDLQQARS